MDKKNNELSSEAQRLLSDLNEEERRIIQKDSPYRNDRVKLIRALRLRGVTQSVLVEVSGLSRDQIQYIVCRGEEYRRNHSQNNLKAALKSLLEVFCSALNKARGKGGVKG